jgi:AMIN domain-containing protein
VSLSCALLGSFLCAQTSDNSQQQPPPQTGTQRVRQLIQQEIARRAAAARQNAQAPDPTTPSPAPTLPGQAPNGAPQSAPGLNQTPPFQAQRNQGQLNQGQLNQTLPTPANPASPATALPGATTPVQPPAAVKSVKVVHDKTGSAIEIVTSRPVPPALQTQPMPPRLVIDLPNANVAVKLRDFPVKGKQFAGVRVDQYQVSPPVTRVVVDLYEARQYTWDGAGNRLTIRLKPPEEPKPATPPPAQPATVPTFSAAAQPPVVPVSSRPAGSAVLAGSRIGSGSTVTASNETAVLHIARGGELHVCPGSTVSVTASKNGQELMFGMSTGALETHYHLNTASDAVLTPDFRMLLAGPGDFDYAISANSHGDTCIRALLGNTASLMVSELMGDRTYQVKPTEQVVFHEGRVDRMSNDVPFDCGCAAPPPPVMRASVPAVTPQVSDANLPPNLHLPSSAAPIRASLDPMLPPLPNASRPAVSGPPGSQLSLASTNPEMTPLPQAKPSDIHVQIEAPLVFRGTDKTRTVTQTASNMPPKPVSAQPKSDPAAPIPPATPPPNPVEQAPAPKQHRGFFGRVKNLFSSMFH